MYLKLVVWPTPLLIDYKFPYFSTLSESWMYVAPVLQGNRPKLFRLETSRQKRPWLPPVTVGGESVRVFGLSLPVLV